MRTKLNLLFAIFVFNVLPALPSIASEYTVDTGQKNTVTFFAKATLTSFSGVTDQIKGTLSWEDSDTLNTSRVHFEVDLASIDTGNSKRNKHMREKYLETDTYPKAEYDGKLTRWTAKNDTTYLVTTEGEITIHSVKRPLTVEARLIKKESGYHVFLQFPLDITDFNIQKPRFLVVTMDTNIQLQLSFSLILIIR